MMTITNFCFQNWTMMMDNSRRNHIVHVINRLIYKNIKLNESKEHYQTRDTYSRDLVMTGNQLMSHIKHRSRDRQFHCNHKILIFDQQLSMP